MPDLHFIRFSEVAARNSKWAVRFAVVAILFLAFSSDVYAQTVYSSLGDRADEVTLNFNYSGSTQHYDSLGEDLPTNISYNKVRFDLGTTTPASFRFWPAQYRDTGDYRTICTTGTCVADDTIIFGSASAVTASLGTDGYYYATLPAEWSATTTFNYFRVTIDPNTPKQILTLATAMDGTRRNGSNTDPREGSFRYQLCSGSCDENWGDYNPYDPGTFSNTDLTFINLEFSGTSGAQTATTTFYVPSEIAGTSQAPDGIAMLIVKDSDVSDVYESWTPHFFQGGAGSLVINTSHIFMDDDYTGAIRFYQQDSGYNTAIEGIGLRFSFTVSSGVITDFVVQSVYNNSDPYNENQQLVCRATDLACHFNNAMMFLFIPNDWALSRVDQIHQVVSSKVPFIYLQQFYDEMVYLRDNATGTIPLLEIDVPLMDSTTTLTVLSDDIFEPGTFGGDITDMVRPFMIALLWFLTAYTLYNRTRKII